MLPITRMISPYNHYDYNNPKFIILHYTGNQTDSALNNAKYFNGGNRNASAHYFVDDTSIYQVVEDNKGAWHIGNTKTEPNNKNSIGIEMCCKDGSITSKTENNALELVKHLMKKYNISVSNVRTHAEVTNYGKICPNWSDNNWQRWNNFKKKLTTTQTANKVSTTSVKKVETVKGEWKVKVLVDTNLWNDTSYKTVGGHVKKDQLLYVTEMTKDYNFFVYGGKYLVNSNSYNYVTNMWDKPIGKIQIKQDCNTWSYANFNKVVGRLKTWDIKEYTDYKNGFYHVPYIGYVHESMVNKTLKLTDALVTN